MNAPVGHWGGGQVWQVISGELPSNAYICSADVPGGCVLIDGGLDPLSIETALNQLGLKPHSVFCTHGHFDHAGAASFFQKKYGSKVFMHKNDSKTLKASNFLLMAFKLTQRIELPDVIQVEADTCIDVGSWQIRFHSTPGHTPGSCVLQLGSALFTGDTIYAGHVGLSKLPGEDPETLKKSILSMWPLMNSDHMIYPGHGRCASGQEVRTNNHELLAFLGLPSKITRPNNNADQVIS